MIELDPSVADEVPWSDNITPYDDQHTITYLRLLDADAEGADWQEVARIVLHRCSPSAPMAQILGCDLRSVGASS